MCDTGLLYGESRQMMIVLLLLGACVCLGLSGNDYYAEREYGSTYRFRLHTMTHFVDFIPKYQTQAKILWKYGYYSGIQDKTWRGVDNTGPWKYYELRYLTQEDSGRYNMKDIYQNLLGTRTIEVVAKKMSFERSPGGSLNFTVDLELESCNIYFSPESDLKVKELETEIVRRSVLQEKGLDKVNCVGFEKSKSCGIFIKSLQMSCDGGFVVRDQKGNKVLMVSLEMKPTFPSPPKNKDISTSGIAIFAGLIITSCCCACLKSCCCGDDTSEDNAETGAAAEPDEPSQPSRIRSPRPSSPPQFQRVVKKATDNVPPAYSEVSAAGTPSAPAVYSDPEPRFEIKGMTLASDTADVYTSDKLNFL